MSHEYDGPLISDHLDIGRLRYVLARAFRVVYHDNGPLDPPRLSNDNSVQWLRLLTARPYRETTSNRPLRTRALEWSTVSYGPLISGTHHECSTIRMVCSYRITTKFDRLRALPSSAPSACMPWKIRKGGWENNKQKSKKPRNNICLLGLRRSLLGT